MPSANAGPITGAELVRARQGGHEVWLTRTQFVTWLASVDLAVLLRAGYRPIPVNGLETLRTVQGDHRIRLMPGDLAAYQAATGVRASPPRYAATLPIDGSIRVMGTQGNYDCDFSPAEMAAAVLFSGNIVTPTPTPTPTPTLSRPTVNRTSAAGTLPPTFEIFTNADHRVGATLRIEAATDVVFASRTVNTTITLAETGMAAAINATLAGINTASYVRFSVEDGGNVSATTDPILVGSTAAAAVISSSAPIQAVSSFKLASVITTDRPCYCYIEGNDMIRFELADNNQPGTSFTLRWQHDDVADFSQPLSGNFTNTYSIDIVLVNLNGVESRTARTVTVLDYDITPDDITIAGKTTAPNTQTDSDEYTVSGLEAGYAMPISVAPSGAKILKKPSGGSYGSPVQSATVQNGDKFKLRRTSDPAYSANLTSTLTYGPYTRTWPLATIDDPSGAGFTLGTAYFSNDMSADGYAATITRIVHFETGSPGLIVSSNQHLDSATIDGVPAVRQDDSDHGQVGIYGAILLAPETTAGDKVVVFHFAGAMNMLWFQPFTGVNLGTVADSRLGPDVNGSGSSVSTQPAANLTIPTGGIGVAVGYAHFSSVLTWANANPVFTDARTVNDDAQVFSGAKVTTTGKPTATSTTLLFTLNVSWNKKP